MQQSLFDQALAFAHKLSPEELDRLLSTLQTERQKRQKPAQSADPFLALKGTWADMGVEGITAFDEDTRQQREELPRPMLMIELASEI